jgi:hypothetical protein
MTDTPPLDGTLVMIARGGMGHADPPLCQKLLRTYLQLLVDNSTIPGAICFYTDGVKLVVEGSPVLDVLQALEAKGCRLVVCMTCLNYFGITDQVKVGVIGGMPDIIAAQLAAAKVITL